MDQRREGESGKRREKRGEALKTGREARDAEGECTGRRDVGEENMQVEEMRWKEGEMS